ncbi:APC membrane recruitment protein 2 [Phaenicophaeus curvirostris]|uniref:APC membrane recruitment protein 2 n=1 Tax=Phaenicophaeus curvirostris TaxID=33595 RepID=UPI0037F09890
MDPRRGCAEPPAAEPPAGRINKTAFKLFKRRKGGGGVPSIFGVRSGGGEGKGAGGAGLVRSRTHDGLAEAAPEGGGKDEPAAGREAPGGPGSVAKSHSFFSLLRKNGKAESAERRPGGRQKKGLRSIFGGVRWHRKDKAGKERRGEASESPPGLTAPGSLTASLECVKEEPPKPPREAAGAERREERPGAAGGAEPAARDPEPGAAAEDAAPAGAAPGATEPLAGPRGERGQEPAAAPDPASSADPPSEPSADRICLMFADVTSLKSFDSLTGCGDIIADREEDAGGRSGGCEKSLPGAGKPGAPRKRPGGVAYQGGGEEMASPEQADDTCLQEFWDMLSHTEETRLEEGGGTKKPEGSKENRGSEGAQNRAAAKRGGTHQIPVHLDRKAEPKGGEKEQQEGVPNSDEGYWDSTTPGPEEDGSAGIQKETVPRDSCSGDALYDLYAEPDETPPAAPGEAAVPCPPRSKPVSPAATAGSLRTPSSTAKDSKIPISIKHLSSHPAGHGTDAANSHHAAHHHPAKSEMHRTKIPVSKVLVRRVSNRGLAGTAARAAAHQDGAKK